MRSRRAPLEFFLLAVVALLVPFGCSKKDSPTAPKVGPVANFVAAPTAGNIPLDVDFTNQSTSGSSAITSVLWDFGDGTTSTANSTTHLYGSPGTYSVSLRVTTADGTDRRTRDDYIVVGNGPGSTPPNAAFTAAPTAGSPPLMVNFTDQSSAGSSPITGWSWDFGDGGTSTLQNPSHTFNANGQYTVALSVTTSVGTDTGTKTNYIVVSPAPVPPTAQFSGTPTDGVIPLTVSFTDQSAPGSAAITSRSWTFGDGAQSTLQNPSHTYTTAGTYTVALTVTTSAGSNTNTKTGYVTARPTPVGPTAQFSGTPRSGSAPLDVQFTDQSVPGTSPISGWSWTFGDGGTSTATNPAHTYASPGSYNVALTVTTQDGQNTNTKTSYITPCATPATAFTGAPTSGAAPLNVTFTDLSTGAPTGWLWTFGDGATSTAQSPSHVYTNPGTYNVSLTTTNACGSDTNTKAGYITAQDPCPNPTYSVVSALWDTRKDVKPPPIGNGFQESARLRWNADVSPTACARSVFAKIYYRLLGDSAWTFQGQSTCYTITDSRTGDLGSFTVSGLPMGCYDFRIVLFECNGTAEKAVLDPSGDPDLTLQCFEP